MNYNIKTILIGYKRSKNKLLYSFIENEGCYLLEWKLNPKMIMKDLINVS